jgi:hypothetical protein
MSATILQKIELEALADWLAEHGFAVKQPSPEQVVIEVKKTQS